MLYRTNICATWLGIIALLAACGGTTTPDARHKGPEHTAKVEPQLAEPNSTQVLAQDSYIVAERIDHVWVFFHRDKPPAEGTKEISLQALNAGVARIVGDCLFVDESIVVWGRLRADDVRAAIVSARRGEPHRLKMSGGGMSLDEGARPESFPSVITERCSTRSIWFAGKLDVADEFPHP